MKINNILIKLILFTIVIVPAVILENMSRERLNLFIVLIALYALLNLSRIFSKKIRSYDLFILIAELMILLTFEMNSKYYINYLFHSLYLLTMIDASINLSVRKAVITNVFALLSSIYKYIKLLRVSMNFNSLSEMIFFMILSALIVFSIILLKYYKIEKERKEDLILELNLAHEKLLESSKLDTELKLSKQRNSIARDIHDTLGHSMTATIMQMEVLELDIVKDPNRAVESSKNIKNTLRDGLSQVRSVVGAFSSFDARDIEELIKDFALNVDISIDYKLEIESSDEAIIQTLYRAVQESLTNSKRHGNASKVSINIIESSDGISYYYKDNGSVDKDWQIGFGLRSMRERFLDLNGYIEFEDRDGFFIDGFISWEGLDD